MAIFDLMKNKLKNAIAISLLPQVIMVKWLGSYPEWIERNYSEGIYPFLSKAYRALLGWVPFSVGDFIYAILAFLALSYVIKARKTIFKTPRQFIRNLGMVLAVAYFTFNFCWGLNYYRQPIAQKFELSKTHTADELNHFVLALIAKTNTLQYTITKDTATAVKIPYSKEEIFSKTLVGYKKIGHQIPFLSYERSSLKKSIFSTPLTYMGYGGYINPFTNEAQVNARLPELRFPVVCAHEIGHQLGYAAENETNFIGYLVCLLYTSPSPRD